MNGLWAASLVLLWVLVVVLAFFVAGALRELGILQLRLGADPGALITDSGLERGSDAPDSEVIEASTGAVTRIMDLRDEPRLLVFMSPSCVACRALVPHLNEVSKTRREAFDFIVVCIGGVEQCRAFERTSRLSVRMLIDPGGEAQRAYEVSVTPFAYLLDYKRRVLMRGVANDWRHLESLLEQEGTVESGRAWTVIGEANGASASPGGRKAP